MHLDTLIPQIESRIEDSGIALQLSDYTLDLASVVPPSTVAGNCAVLVPETTNADQTYRKVDRDSLKVQVLWRLSANHNTSRNELLVLERQLRAIVECAFDGGTVTYDSTNRYYHPKSNGWYMLDMYFRVTRTR